MANKRLICSFARKADNGKRCASVVDPKQVVGRCSVETNDRLGTPLHGGPAESRYNQRVACICARAMCIRERATCTRERACIHITVTCIHGRGIWSRRVLQHQSMLYWLPGRW